jgi:hypothetical protein
MTEPPRRPVSRDVALLYAPTDDGKGARILRSRDGALETGEIRPVKEGRPLTGGELVRLAPRPDTPCVCDVQVLHELPQADGSARETGETRDARELGEGSRSEPTGRPAQVATADYRLNWDRVFGSAHKRRTKRDTSLN